MKRSLHILFCLLAALQLGVGHLGVMQVVAWAKMVHDYSAEDGLVEGLKRTFDGDHPCALCCQIEREREDAERSQLPLPLMKLAKDISHALPVAFTAAPKPRWMPADDGVRCVAPVLLSVQWESEPAVPPPRAVV